MHRHALFGVIAMSLTSMFGAACGRAAEAGELPDPKTDLQAPATQPAAGDAAATQPAATVVLAGGCFWCTEAVFEQLAGVSDVESGYAGGEAETANYKAVTTGRTGHAEAIRITYDPAVISYGQLLKVFFSTAHDPTQLNRQGADVGTQYRSAIFFASDDEQRVAKAYIEQLNEAVFDGKIVTTLEPLDAFYPAEAYHQDYAEANPDQGYIRGVAKPKVDKTRKVHKDKLKDKRGE